MALKNYKPTSPGQRGLVLVDKSGLWKGRPEKTLTKGLTKKGGRNSVADIIFPQETRQGKMVREGRVIKDHHLINLRHIRHKQAEVVSNCHHLFLEVVICMCRTVAGLIVLPTPV